jgi:hypothetical protein
VGVGAFSGRLRGLVVGSGKVALPCPAWLSTGEAMSRHTSTPQGHNANRWAFVIENQRQGKSENHWQNSNPFVSRHSNPDIL